MKCRKYPTCVIFLKSIKHDILDCQIHIYTNTNAQIQIHKNINTQIQNMTKWQKYQTYAIFLNSWWFKDVINDNPKCSDPRYRVDFCTVPPGLSLHPLFNGFQLKVFHLLWGRWCCWLILDAFLIRSSISTLLKLLTFNWIFWILKYQILNNEHKVIRRKLLI